VVAIPFYKFLPLIPGNATALITNSSWHINGLTIPMRLMGIPPVIDGKLTSSHAGKMKANGHRILIQNIPVERALPTYTKSRMKILYDNRNIYFALWLLG